MHLRLFLIVAALVGVAVRVLAGTEEPFSKPADVVVARLEKRVPIKNASAFLWNEFSQRPEMLGFRSYSTDDWAQNYDAFSTELVRKAKASGLEAESLSGVLKLVLSTREDLAYLPVGAYRVGIGDHECWIVLIKWEIPPRHFSKPKITKDGFRLETHANGLGHVRMFAYDMNTMHSVAFNTCM
ncbi:hypothetical protein DB347_25410 [Opitutaceae bacterium EW11]|nr:hypothetical protein DB347_25410 [Opitutaceae bacterium EW11]